MKKERRAVLEEVPLCRAGSDYTKLIEEEGNKQEGKMGKGGGRNPVLQ